jgi:penicillin-binding protein 2
VERRLTEIIIAKLRSSEDDNIPMRAFLASMIRANSVSVSAMMTADEESYAWPIRQYITREAENPNGAFFGRTPGDIAFDAVQRGMITENVFLLAMYEQGIIHPTNTELDRLQRGLLNRQQTLALIERMLNEGFITPSMTYVQPNTASVVVVCVNSGAVLASVSYPSYDNNRFVNTFDNAYWIRLNNDMNTPLQNRPFSEQRAVGSTFKMLTAVAGLENRVITPTTRFFCERTFRRGGHTLGCTGHHSNISVERAITVSCNVFFYETAFRLGNTGDGTMLQGINRLNEYMLYFGFGSPTGVEIYDVFNSLTANLPPGVNAIPSPAFRQHRGRLPWMDGDTLQLAIGQADLNATPALMAKYTATLASRGVRYQMHFLSHITQFDGTEVARFEPVIEQIVPMSGLTVNTVLNGMLNASMSSSGTAFRVFEGFPVQVAGKTGTAQEARWANHSTFAAFAPFSNPQIAVYVSLPGSVQNTVRSPAAVVARDIFEVYFRIDSQPQRPNDENVLIMR